MSRPFWQTKSLDEMSPQEWESLCDGCGRCCLVKLQDADTDIIATTSVACDLLDCEACRCGDYANRAERVPDCVPLTPHEVRTLPWLPPTCAYRLLAEGKELRWWHHLVCGDPEMVHTAGISVRGRVSAFEKDVPIEQIEDHIADWPGEDPRPRRSVI
jgi:uncharacterized cysteine cluster protein YcgN (CxxCxxCC family)